MNPSEISNETRLRVDALFPTDLRNEVLNILATKCGNNLPGLGALGAVELERFQFAALKQSRGTIEGLQKAIELANLDWRDLLMGAGFGHDLNAHEAWFPK
jgi:hypothetical protein